MMRIAVLNGSPKGKDSITLQTVLYLEKKFPQHVFDVVHVGQRIRALEKDFGLVEAAVRAADAVLFVYPVYTFIATYQMHKCIRLMKERGVDVAGKYASQITTSKHFYDVTAHRYVQENCQNMGMKVIRGLSADMDDLLTEKGQKEARDFMDFFAWSVEHDAYEQAAVRAYEPVHAAVTAAEAVQADAGDVVIVTDCDNPQLEAMIARFRAVLPRKSRVVNLRDQAIQGGCLGCFHCAVSGKCVYKDGFDAYLREQIQTGEAIVYAFTVQDHSMGPLFKMYDDRQFCNGHRTVTMGMPMGYLVSGDLSREGNLATIIEARVQVGGNFLAGVATDEADPDGQIDQLAATLCYALDHQYVPPQNFWGVGGMKIFRDLIWLMQGMMKADHKFYKAHGQYDFPQKKFGTMLKMYLVGMLLHPKLQAKVGGKMTEGMLMPYKKVLEGDK